MFKVTACGDTMYIKAESVEAAQEKLFALTGPIPTSLLHWERWLVAPPNGEEAID